MKLTSGGTSSAQFLQILKSVVYRSAEKAYTWETKIRDKRPPSIEMILRGIWQVRCQMGLVDNRKSPKAQKGRKPFQKKHEEMLQKCRYTISRIYRECNKRSAAW